jgi:hypothetical protein
MLVCPPAWPWLIDLGAVHCFAEHDGTMYFGGSFVQVNGTTRNHVAAVDAATGVLTAWDPNAQSGGNEIYALATDAASVFIGGILDDIDGTFDGGILPVDPQSGAPQITEDVFSQWDVHALLVAGSTLYAGGGNSVVFGNSRPGLAGYGISDLPTGVREQPDMHAGRNSPLLWPDPYTSGPLRVALNPGEKQVPNYAELLDASGRCMGTLHCAAECSSDHGATRGTLSGMEELDPAPGLYFVRMTFAHDVRIAPLMVQR